MNTVIITRTKYTDKETFGILTAHRNGEFFQCLTLELPWKNNQRNISCIPKGFYTAQYTYWESKKRYNYLLNKVPNRGGIYIHYGNYAYRPTSKPDIEGCILLGSSYGDLNDDNVDEILNTKATVEAFQKFMNKEPFDIKIQ